MSAVASAPPQNTDDAPPPEKTGGFDGKRAFTHVAKQVGFGYFITLPYILRFLVSFQGPVVPMISINEYFDLILMVLLGLGLVFELPILIFFLSLFGIVTPKFLWKNFRYAILIIAIVAAIVTPTPDAMTLLIFMAPMVGLYFVGIAVSYLVTRRRERRLATPVEAG